jgi:hypothetical protein
MTNRHTEPLAAQRDIDVVYSYAYGVSRAMVSNLADGLWTVAKFVAEYKQLEQAVIERLAAYQAEMEAEDLAQERAITRRPAPTPEPDRSPIYVSDENGSERSNTD